MKGNVVFLGFLVVAAGSPAWAEMTFTGQWDTTFGPMTLTQQGKAVTGLYVWGGKKSTIQGNVEKSRLTFTYQEPTVAGEGEFDLAADGKSFKGTWRAKGAAGRGEWTGTRVVLGFDGLWKTSFGSMRLVGAGTRVEGVYSGGASLSGELKCGRFVFQYQEPAVKGEGWFELAADGNSFQGKWKPAGKAAWSDWTGTRIQPEAGRVWLVVLEVPWENGLAEKEYAFGKMLKAFFARAPHVQVRHKIFNSETGLRRWCGELAFLAEPVVLVLASHGSPQGIAVGGKSIGAKPLVDSLRYASNVRLLHFSACETMKGKLAEDIGKGLGKGRRLPVSGYTTSVDWAASAVIEFMYLDMILVRGMTPEAAALQIVKLMPFAGDRVANGSPFPAAGFRMLVLGSAGNKIN